MRLKTMLAALAAIGTASAVTANAQTPFKVGVIAPMTGPFQSTGRQIEAGVKYYVASHGDVVAGRKIEIVLRDDGGVPDTSRRLAQELIVRDKVGALLGFGLTPIALAVAPVATQGKVPEIVTVAATSSIPAASPYIVRASQITTTLGAVPAEWALKNNIKRVVTLVSDYGPGIDVEKWFSDSFKAHGGEIVANLRVPLANPDFAPFLQRVADAKPDAVYVFVPTGVGAIFAKQFIERGLDKSGIKVIATGDVLDDDIMNSMGDVTLGMISVGPYSATHDSAVNKAFVTGIEKANPGMRPDHVAVFSYDGMHLIYGALEKTKGAGDGTALVEAMKGMAWESPRGPVSIDPATRDIVENLYMRKVEKVGGDLFNNEFSTAPNVKDPAK